VGRFVVISGCSGGGKSTLLAEIRRRGHPVVEEPGRRIVKEELEGEGSALPWIDGTAFARRAVALALADRASAGALDGWVFFDRGLIDAAAGLQHLTGEPVLTALGQSHRYHCRVFLAPPWPEIYVTDPERRHGLEGACGVFPPSRSLSVAWLRSLYSAKDRCAGTCRLHAECAREVPTIIRRTPSPGAC
jgi:predicted ATPase